MSQVEITATFSSESAAHEALHKLHALRAFDVTGQHESTLLTATVEEAVAERALHLIEQVGGDAITTIS